MKTWLGLSPLKEKVSCIKNNHLASSEVELPGGLCLLAPQAGLGQRRHTLAITLMQAELPLGNSSQKRVCLPWQSWQGKKLFTSLTHREGKCQHTSGINKWIWNANLFTIHAVGIVTCQHYLPGTKKTNQTKKTPKLYWILGLAFVV